MADFQKAIPVTLQHEGGFVDDPADPGGATKYGITQKDLNATFARFNVELPGFPSDVRNLTEPEAAYWYEHTTEPERFNNPLYWQIQDQDLATKLFDMGVLFGVGEAVKLLQITLQPAYPDVHPDGNFGPTTLARTNESDAVSLLNAYKTSLVSYTLRIAVAKPNEKKFVAGWGHRINS